MTSQLWDLVCILLYSLMSMVEEACHSSTSCHLQLTNHLLHKGKLKGKNQMPHPECGVPEDAGGRLVQVRGAPPAMSARRRQGPTASPAAGPQTATTVHDLHTGSQLPSFAESQRCLEFPRRPGAVQENEQRLNFKCEVQKTRCLSPLCDL